MRVLKRDGTFQPVDFNKITQRIQYMIEGRDHDGISIGEPLTLDSTEIAQEVVAQLIDGISTTKVDEFTAELCAYRAGDSDDYAILASRIIISNHHKKTVKYAKFSAMTERLYHNYDADGHHSPVLAKDYYDAVMRNQVILDQICQDSQIQDYVLFDFFGFKTIEKSYLLKPSKSQSNPESQSQSQSQSQSNQEFVQERPQHMLLREAVQMYMNCPNEIEEIQRAYRLSSMGYISQASPTKFNSGTVNPQMSSCFLGGVHDSIDGMYENLRRNSHISKMGGGIGVSIGDIRGVDSTIRSTHGKSSGLIPYLRVKNAFANHVDQSGKRKGSIAVYFEPWHREIFELLDLRKSHGAEEMRARDLFLALWIPNIFMRRVQRALIQERVTQTHNQVWSLMCPDQCSGLTEAFGDDFDKLYQTYEQQGRFIKQVNILELWRAIMSSQMETGVPYMCAKDHANQQSNQKNLGTLKNSNLCAEIYQYSDYEEISVCNLNAINLSQMVGNGTHGKPYFDFQKLYETAKQANRNLNRVIDVTHTPVHEAQISNFRHRAVATGVMGLADVFIKLGFAFESEEATQLDSEIFETIYYACCDSSCELAEHRAKQLALVPKGELDQLIESSGYVDYTTEYLATLKRQQRRRLTPVEEDECARIQNLHDRHLLRAQSIINQYQLNPQILEYQYLNPTGKYLGAYSSFDDSPASQGLLQFDLSKMYATPEMLKLGIGQPSSRWDWDALKTRISQFGLRNSLMVALMPTATTAQILGVTECFEPITTTIFARGVLAGTFLVVNRSLQRELTRRGIWSKPLKDKILIEKDLDKIAEIPDDLKKLYKIGWNMSMKLQIERAAKRQAWVDQGQSLNYHIKSPSVEILSACFLHSWKLGLKTMMYYLRRRPVVDPQKFSVDLTAYKANQLITTKVGNDTKNKTTSDNQDLDPVCGSGGCSV
jgi:ribonucleotide reductase alpha subunit